MPSLRQWRLGALLVVMVATPLIASARSMPCDAAGLPAVASGGALLSYWKSSGMRASSRRSSRYRFTTRPFPPCRPEPCPQAAQHGSWLPRGSPDHPPEIVGRRQATPPATRPGRGAGGPSPFGRPLPGIAQQPIPVPPGHLAGRHRSASAARPVPPGPPPAAR